MKPWFIGNTTVRNPYRLRDGLISLSASSLNGNLVGTAQEIAFLELLRETGVIESNEGDRAFFGRKWRSAFAQLGFITAKLSRFSPKRPFPESGIDPKLAPIVMGVPGLTGRPYEITESGRRLIAAELPSQQQECFLRAIAAYRFPSVGDATEDKDGNEAQARFSPLRLVLRILSELRKTGLSEVISREEMASIVVFENNENNVSNAIHVIDAYRRERAGANNQKVFDRAYREAAVAKHENVVTIGTLDDYRDINFRYLRATGLFVSIGDSIGIAPEKQRLADRMLDMPESDLDTPAYLRQLWAGSVLPTDSRDEAREVIDSVAVLLRAAGKPVEMPDISSASIQDVTQIRLRLENEYRNVREEEYAKQQVHEWEDIVETMRKLAKNRRDFPDPPAYLEWVLWRAFLAINSLSNKPWDSRRFNVDRDFLPMHTAPGNGPDMIFEFDDFILVVEVTFTASSRQEGAEGEPVRRHVAMAVERETTGKPVFGLFIANAIDSNTAETFRIGTWYRPDDSRLALRIVPLTLTQFCDIFAAAFQHHGRLEPAYLMQLLKDCLVHKGEDGPRWKSCIADEVTGGINRMYQRI